MNLNILYSRHYDCIGKLSIFVVELCDVTQSNIIYKILRIIYSKQNSDIYYCIINSNMINKMCIILDLECNKLCVIFGQCYKKQFYKHFYK